MAATAIRKSDGKGNWAYALIVSLPGETGVDLAIHAVGPDYVILENTKPLEYGVDSRDEALYHKSLRVEAAKLDQFVPEFSTNPEWNPGGEEKEEITDEINRGD